MSRSKYFCFTINNYTNDDVDRLSNLGDEITYIVFGREVGESGTPHLQGYVEFRNRKRFPQVKTLLGNRVHLEKRRGSPQEASDYCKKDGDFEEIGELSRGQGMKPRVLFT